MDPRLKAVKDVVIVFGIILAAGCLVSASFLFPALVRGREQGAESAKVTRLKSSALAILLYVESTDGFLPPAKSWMDATLKYAISASDYQSGDPKSGIAYFEALSGTRKSGWSEPESVPLVFESIRPGWNLAGGQELLPSKDRPLIISLSGEAARTPKWRLSQGSK